MKKLLQSLFILMFVAGTAMAQDRTITGTVTDQEDGKPLPGVSVKIVGAKGGTQTGGDGRYSLVVPTGTKELTFSYLGYVTLNKQITSNVVNAVLNSDSQVLSEVVVTGALGIQRQKKELGYAATSLTNAEVNKAKPVNIANGLQGKVSGLNITTMNSGVFEDVKINLRGIRSLTGNNNPMLLLDGVQVPLTNLASLNPNDVESTTILKGASSAAIYGPDAVNGVIVITTKKGKEDSAAEITLSNSTQFSSISFFPKFQTKFGSGGPDPSQNLTAGYTGYENWSWGPAFDGSLKPVGHPFTDGTPEQMLPYTANNSRKEFFNTAATIQNDVSLRTATTYISLQDANVKGIVPDDESRRTGLRLNTTQKYGKLTTTAGLNYSQQNYNVFNDDAMGDYNAANNVGLNGGLMNLIFNTPAQIPITSYKDFKNNPYATYNGYFTDYGINPYIALDNWRTIGKRENLIANLDLKLKATDWLDFTYRAAITSNHVGERNISKGQTASPYGEGRGFVSVPQTVEEREYRYQQLSSEVFASFNKTFAEDFKVGGVLGSYLRQRDQRDTRVGASNLVIPGLYNISERTGELTGSSPASRSRLLSFYGSASLSYKGWANIEVTGRNDQTSVLGLNNNSFFYPGVSGSLVLTDAFPSLKENDYLSFMKLRASWSKSGNADINPYLLAATYSQANGFPYGGVPGYTANNRTYDADLKPEFIKSSEVGLELGFLKDRISFEVSYFNQNNTNQIIPIAISNATGYTSYQINAASFVNKGVDLDLGLTPLVSIKDVRINFKVNASYNDSEIKSIYSGLDELFIGGFTSAGNYAIVGSPAFVFKATDYLRDPQGRVIVDANTGRPTADPVTKKLGRTMPVWIVGLNPSVRWKNLTFSALFEYKGGHYAYHDIGNAMAWTGVSEATATNNRERYVLPNSSYADPANPGQYIANTNVAIGDINSFYTGEFRDVATNFITKATSWRLREVSLGYDIPVKVLGNQKIIKGLSVAVTGRNLFLWVPKTNVYGDPDFTFGTTTGSNLGVSNSNVSGVADSKINPPVRTIGGSVVIKF
jgi:TonB-linked SusC/RagA family outer membrane protein